MSYDINFWKQERPLELSPQEVYERLSSRQLVDGLAKLPVDEILARLKEAYPDFDPAESFPLARTSEGSIEFSWSDYHFRFDIRGVCGDCQKLVDIMTDFGCPMYDPQLGKRYDADNGMALGERQVFEDTSPEQKAELERLKAEFLAGLSGSQKKGCAGKAAMFLIALAGAVWASVSMA